MSSESPISEQDLYLFNEGTHYRLHERLGAHPRLAGAAEAGATAGTGAAGAAGTHFAVWAPNAQFVSVIGDWNGWNKGADPLARRGGSGIWEGFVPGVGGGARYKYHIASRYRGYRVDKADPFAFCAETPPRQASVVWELDYRWGDGEWLAGRRERQSLAAPISIYELHLGSWRRVPEAGNRSLGYREIAPLLAAHLKRLGFTHVELMPIMEHPFYGSWGYQTTGYFAPTRRYGTPQDLMYLIDTLHQEGIGVILDWVPSHFPTDEHGLGFFDGTHLYEHADPRQGFQPDWGSLIFNYGRREVRSFMISSAAFWLEKYHADGLRIDAVASMLYLDYSRQPGEWLPNVHGGRENLEAIEFLRELNGEVYLSFPGCQTFAEESTAWPMVSRPAYLGGLGFGFKWDMGWMHDTLDYLEKDPIYRRFHQNLLTFRGIYAWSENFVLPLSHDEVVYGKGSLAAKMPGDQWQGLANLRLLLAWMYAQPGKKLLFMGAELGQWREWNHEASLDWHLLDEPAHAGLCRWLEDLNRLYREEPAMHQLDAGREGFAWIDGTDNENSVLAFARHGRAPAAPVVAVFNFTPMPRTNYRIGVPGGGTWRELLNSDSPHYGGSGQGNFGSVDAAPVPLHGLTHSLTLTLPPLGALFLQSRQAAEEDAEAAETRQAEEAAEGQQAGELEEA
ncbi:MAG TPA: 1,4-alpha-glucan branching protein GlgB [Thermoanaerobaculia bacterium]|nr:1,4-alpha-glucan branching protein GlgB [Thermoanaerobaculia bacterium]